MSDPASWTERTVPIAGARRPAPAPLSSAAIAEEPAGPELVVNHDGPDADPFTDHRDYVAVRSVMGRAAQDACFIDGDGVPHLKPWAYYQGAEAHPAQRRITLHWPGCRVEVTGEKLQSVSLLIMTRRAGVWRVFNAARHVRPADGLPVITGIRVVGATDAPAR